MSTILKTRVLINNTTHVFDYNLKNYLNRQYFATFSLNTPTNLQFLYCSF